MLGLLGRAEVGVALEAPAVTMKLAPEIGEVVWPTTMSGWTPGMTSGLPALPMPTIRPSRMPMSALTMPATASMMVAFLMTMSRILSRGVAVPVDALAVAQVLAGADQQFVAVGGVVVFDLGEELVSPSRTRSPLVGP